MKSYAICFAMQESLFPYVTENIEEFLTSKFNDEETKKDNQALRELVSLLYIKIDLQLNWTCFGFKIGVFYDNIVIKNMKSKWCRILSTASSWLLPKHSLVHMYIHFDW